MATLEAVFLQLHPSREMNWFFLMSAIALKPTISVELLILMECSFLPAWTLIVLESASKPRNFPFNVLDGQPANTEPAIARDARIENNFFIMGIYLVVNN